MTATLGLFACGGGGLLLPDDSAGEASDGGDGDGDGDGDSIGDPDDGTETGANFVPLDLVGEEQCDPWAQDCQEGEKCVPYGSTGGNWDNNKCVPVEGDGQPGDTCVYGGTAAATDDCGADSHCWDVMDVDGQAVGVCTPFCSGNPDSPICGPGTSCLVANEGSITLCIETCDPLLQACSEGLGCFWANNEFNCIFTAGDIPEAEPCGFVNDCAPGLLCTTGEVLPSCTGSNCCTAYCELSSPECPVEGTECSPFFEEGTAPPTYEDVGLCILPGA
ncbi:ribulose phosphate epimerase [Enhygromyxa salina]|uniref:ribulose phosphate epimerase n=1 Tax=Enhygromyxa salina TaxID=215803 RepID=UPI001FD3D3AD|nr:ribulose phosphate epimerase [Enhygromyxa salina]